MDPDVRRQNGSEKIHTPDWRKKLWHLGVPVLSCLVALGAALALILPAAGRVLKEGGHIACLIKPQFEAGRDKVGKKGVVRDPAVHLEVLEHFLAHAKQAGFTVLDLTFSPIRGPEGNIEYLGYLVKGEGPERSFDLKALVEQSHHALDHGKEEI